MKKKIVNVKKKLITQNVKNRPEDTNGVMMCQLSITYQNQFL
jgi:hypothetical protein